MSRKTFIVLMALCAALALSAFAIVPVVNYSVNGAGVAHSMLSNDTPWIMVSDISTEVKDSIQYIIVHVEGDHGTMIPRFPEIVINNVVYGDLMSSVSFDDDMNFESADFVFGIPANEGTADIDILSINEIRISNAMTKAVPDVASTYTSDIGVTAVQ